MDTAQNASASAQFTKEHPEHWSIFTFAWHQGCDDFAGFRIVDGQPTDEVIYYHPSFSGHPEPGIVTAIYPNLWAFLREVVLPETADWITDESDLKYFEHPTA
jgi:hypothetical protein